MLDRTSKIILAAIAAGLWANAALPILKPGTASAQIDINSVISRIDESVAKIARGACSNSKIC